MIKRKYYNFTKTENVNFYDLHQKLLEILIYFINICKQNNLTYYAAFGTLLGAVRNNGFIPWDNDIDIQMPRDDYEKFLNIFINNDKYEIQSIRHTIKYINDLILI